MWFVEVIGPLDAVYVGPFHNPETAEAHACDIHSRNSMFDTVVMSKPQMDRAIIEYGDIPLQAPEQWE